MKARFLAAWCAVVWPLLVSAQGAPKANRGSDIDTPSVRRPVAFQDKWLEPYFGHGAVQAAVERFRLDDWAGSAKGLTKALASMPRSAEDRLPARYLLGLARMNAGEWSAAETIFEDLYTKYPLLAPYHAYNAARCHLKRGDAAGAIAWAGRVGAKVVLEAEADLIKIDALVTEKRWAEVENEARSYLEQFPSGPRRAEATFRRAQALEALKRPTSDSLPLYRRLWAESPTEAWANRAGERLEALAAAASGEEAKRIRVHTAEEWVQRGMALFDRNQNSESESAFASALAAPGLTPALECRARYHRGQSVWKQRQRPRAAPLFHEAEAPCQAAGDSDLLVKSLYQGARCLAASGDKDGALKAYARIEAEFPQHSYADDARLRAAEVATDMDDDALAETLLKEIPQRYPRGDLVGESLWRLAFRAWGKQEWDKARGWLDENLRLVPREDVWYAEGRAHYWKGRIFEKQGARDDAKVAYTRAVREYPLSVYALLSLERLRGSFPETRTSLLKELRKPLIVEPAGKAKRAVPWKFSPRPVFGEPAFLRGVELARLGLGSEARRELAKLGFATPESREAARKGGTDAAENSERADIFWITAILLDRGRLWSASHSIPRYTLTSYRLGYPAGRGVVEWRIAYPRAFPELVAKNSRANDVPEAMQLAIMREESAFNPRIESFANALGLTQMLVRTAQRFATYKVTRDALLEPARNLEVGSRFLSFLLQHYGGAVPLAIAGYNAGEAAVDRWLRDHPDLELDEFLESIPYDETRNYTKRVMASYAAYSWLYFPQRPVPPINFSLHGRRGASPPTERGRRQPPPAAPPPERGSE